MQLVIRLLINAAALWSTGWYEARIPASTRLIRTALHDTRKAKTRMLTTTCTATPDSTSYHPIRWPTSLNQPTAIGTSTAAGSRRRAAGNSRISQQGRYPSIRPREANADAEDQERQRGGKSHRDERPDAIEEADAVYVAHQGHQRYEGRQHQQRLTENVASVRPWLENHGEAHDHKIEGSGRRHAVGQPRGDSLQCTWKKQPVDTGIPTQEDVAQLQQSDQDDNRAASLSQSRTPAGRREERKPQRQPRSTKATAVTGFIATRPGTRLLSTSLPTIQPHNAAHPATIAVTAAHCGISRSARARTSGPLSSAGCERLSSVSSIIREFEDQVEFVTITSSS